MNYYDVLRINKSASQQEIKAAYKKLIKRYHPDLYPGNKVKAEAITRDLNEAYDVLSDPEKRDMYDLSLEDPEPIVEYNQTQKNHIYTYKSTYSASYNKDFSEEENKPGFEEKLKKNIHTFVDKKSEQMSQQTKYVAVLLIIFFSLLILLFTLKDFIDFQFSIQERRRKNQELNSVQNIQENELIQNIQETDIAPELQEQDLIQNIIDNQNI